MTNDIELRATHADEDGASTSKTLDLALALTGYTDFTVRRILLAAGAVDQVLAFTGVVALILYSHDNPFKVRLAAGETLAPNTRLVVLYGHDEDEAVCSTSVLLSGNGTTPSSIEAWLVEQPA